MAVTLNANTSTGFIATSDTSGVLQLQTGGTTGLTVSAAQVVTLANPLPVASGGSGGTTSTGTGANVLGTTPSFTSTIGVGGATASASGAGITFPATQSASSDANTLDDYEEGTWTPAFSATGATWTYTAQAGVYVKVGQMVTAQFYLKPASLSGTTTGNVVIANLPFACINSGGSGLSQFPAAQWSTSAISNIPVTESGTTNAYMWKQGTSVSIMTAAEVGTSYYVGTFTYRAST